MLIIPAKRRYVIFRSVFNVKISNCVGNVFHSFRCRMENVSYRLSTAISQTAYTAINPIYAQLALKVSMYKSSPKTIQT